MKYKKNISVLKYLIILFALYSIFLTPITSVRAVSPTRYRTGYWGTNNPDGFRGNLLTIDSPMDWNEFLAEWGTVIISYTQFYWVQLGFCQHWYFLFYPWFGWPTMDFYLERQDAYYHWRSYFILKPIIGHTYTYELYYKMMGDPYAWHFKVSEGQNTIWFGDTSTSPSTRIDLQAMVETSKTNIDIDGSHFTSLKYYNNLWYSWSGHITNNYDYPPYYTESISHREFYAWGGG